MSWPESERFLVIAGGTGYLVDCRTPERTEEIDLRPIVHKLEAGSGLVVLGDRCTLAGFSSAGIAWVTERLSWDGMRRLVIEDDAIHGEGYEASTDAWVGFDVDLKSGRHAGGARPPSA